MNLLHLLPVGDPGPGVLDDLCAALPPEFGARGEILRAPFDAQSARNPGRQQYHSTQILAGMQSCMRPETWRLVAVTPFDLYIPILTFVFGEAQLSGPCAVVSTFRLRQEFYGLPSDPALLRQRLLKESIHELCHTLGLIHCEDYQCAMAPSHAVEWIDLKQVSLCENCRARLGQKRFARTLPAPAVLTT
ncbi:MAG TPA: archemetzincin [Terriglobia bacterium]|nr:archemetzincin [Terriglobia bacterium]